MSKHLRFGHFYPGCHMFLVYNCPFRVLLWPFTHLMMTSFCLVLLKCVILLIYHWYIRIES